MNMANITDVEVQKILGMVGDNNVSNEQILQAIQGVLDTYLPLMKPEKHLGPLNNAQKQMLEKARKNFVQLSSAIQDALKDNNKYMSGDERMDKALFFLSVRESIINDKLKENK
jgi:hypothetical protein